MSYDRFVQSRIPRMLRPPVFVDEEKNKVANLLNIILLATLLTDIVFHISLLLFNSSHDPIINVAFGLVAISLIGLSFLLRRGRVRLTGILFAAIFLITFSWFIWAFDGIRDSAITGFFFLVVMASLITNRRVMFTFTMISMAVIIATFIAEHSGWIQTQFQTPPAVVSVVMVVLALILTAVMLHISVQRLSEAYEQTRDNERALADTNEELQRNRANLASRTRELEASSQELEAKNAELETTLETSQRRSRLLQASTEVSRAIARIRDVDQLLSQVTFLISQQFGFYHTGIFLVDESGLNAVLRAANSPGGQKMLARGHRLGVGTAGIVGFVTGSGRTRVARRAGTDIAYFDNPDLPETQSEVAIPLNIAGRTIGALDVQSTQPDDFDQEDIATLTALADQISIGIENVDLLKRAKATLQEAEAAQRRYIRDEWDSYLGQQPIPLSPIPQSEDLKAEGQEAQS